jgi:hypothetical protein
MARPTFTVKYVRSDFGTERAVIVTRDDTGAEVGRRDPFWPVGIPVDQKRHDARIREVGREMLADAIARFEVQT